MDLTIYFGQRRVALVDAGPTSVTLTYDDDWIAAPDRFPVSLSMPLNGGPYAAERVLPWLMNLLPEGDPLRAISQALGISPEDVIGLIESTGADLAGALSVTASQNPESSDLLPIPDAVALERIINNLPARPFLVGQDGVSMSLAGAQDKLPVAVLGDQIAIPINGAASTHILKPNIQKLHGSVQNEALCMVLAGQIGLNVATVTTGVAGERQYLLVDRYDRSIRNGSVERLHQEDFCQALARPPVAKYESNKTGAKGVTLAEMFGVIRRNMTARDITRFLDAVIFNIAIGNVDSHAKNYSILLTDGTAQLAPLYDLMSGLAWQNITPNHAQYIGSQRQGRHIHRRHWEAMAKDAGISPNMTIKRIDRVVTGVLRELDNAANIVSGMPAGAGAMLEIFRDEIRQRATLVRNNSRITG